MRVFLKANIIVISTDPCALKLMPVVLEMRRWLNQCYYFDPQN